MMRYLLFDLDRTIWDFDSNALITYRSMFNDLGISEICGVNFESFHERYKVINDSLWEAYRNGTITKELLSIRRFSLTLSAFGCDADSLPTIRLAHQMADYYVDVCAHQTRLIPGARELLEWLFSQRDTYRFAVITNGFSEAQVPKMKASGIDRFFDHFFLSEELGVMKPNRVFFDKALKQMNAHHEQCLVIGDDYGVDVAGAMTAGIAQVWYNPRLLPLPQGAKPPDHEIHHLLELRSVLNQWL